MAGAHIVIAQGGVQRSHVGGVNLSKDEGGERSAIVEDKPTVVGVVTVEVFLPFQVCEKGLVEFEQVIDDGGVETRGEAICVAVRFSHDGRMGREHLLYGWG